MRKVLRKIKKMREIIIYILLLTNCIAFAQLSVTEKEEQLLLDEMRLFRNEIFARQGQEFKSKDLQNHFNAKNWYQVDSLYSESKISEREKSAAKTLLKIEENYSKYDKYEKENAKEIFLTIKNLTHKRLDTTFITVEKFDNDSEIDTIYTSIYEQGQDIKIKYSFYKRNALIWSDSINNPYLWIGNTPPLDNSYNDLFQLAMTATKGCVAQKNDWNNPIDDLVLNIGVAYINSQGLSISKEEYKKYITEFKGELLIYKQDESGGQLSIWYEPLKDFIIFYAP